MTKADELPYAHGGPPLRGVLRAAPEDFFVDEDLDFEPEKFKHLYLNEIPERYKSKVDVRRFSSGERIVFLPYTEEMFKKTQDWMQARGLFEDRPAALDYAASVAA